jgi:hypothetical protein
MRTKQKPMDLLKEFAPEFAQHQMVARYMEQATVNDTAATSFEWLNEKTETEK